MMDTRAYTEQIWKDSRVRLAMTLLDAEPYDKIVVDALFGGLDIDRAEYHFLVQLSLIGNRTGWLYFPEQATGRLKGLMRYNTVKNHLLLDEVSDVCRRMGQDGLEPVLTGDLAAAFHCENFFFHKIPFARLICDPSRKRPSGDGRIRFGTKPFGGQDGFKLLSDESSVEKIAGKDVRIPCVEDIVISILADAYYGIIARMPGCDALQWMVGLSTLSGKIDWDRLADRSVSFGVRKQVATMLAFADALLPGLVPAGMMDTADFDAGWLDRRLGNYVPNKMLEAEALDYFGILDCPKCIYLLKSVCNSVKFRIFKGLNEKNQ